MAIYNTDAITEDEAITDEITLHFVRLEADYILSGLGVKQS